MNEHDVKESVNIRDGQSLKYEHNGSCAKSM